MRKIKETHFPLTEKLIVNCIRVEIKDLTSAYISVDTCTKRQMLLFISFTVHFVDGYFKLKYCLLFCQRFVERHRAVNIATDMKIWL